jgi:purine nucleosidase
MNCRIFALAIALLLTATPGQGQTKRKVIIDQDAMGPAGTDQNSMLVLIQSPGIKPVGTTVVTGDGWRDEEVAHTLRMLEIIGRTDIPVLLGAVFPLVNSKAGIEEWEKVHGRIRYMGAWFINYPQWKYHDPFVVPELKEGNPKAKPSSEDAAHFMVRVVRQYPHQITIYAAGALTNLALAMELDPEFPERPAGEPGRASGRTLSSSRSNSNHVEQQNRVVLGRQRVLDGRPHFLVHRRGHPFLPQLLALVGQRKAVIDSG